MKIYVSGIKKNVNTSNYKRGKGIGSVLLDGGLGGQSSYSDIEDYVRTVNYPVINGKGIDGLEKIRQKMQDLTIKHSNPKIKNIKFSI